MAEAHRPVTTAGVRRSHPLPPAAGWGRREPWTRGQHQVTSLAYPRLTAERSLPPLLLPPGEGRGRPRTASARLDTACSWREAQAHIRRWYQQQQEEAACSRRPRGPAADPLQTSEDSRKKSVTFADQAAADPQPRPVPSATPAPASAGGGTVTSAAAKIFSVTAAPRKLLSRRRTGSMAARLRGLRSDMDQQRLKTFRRFRSVLQSVKLVCSVSLRMRRESQKENSDRPGLTALFCSNADSGGGEGDEEKDGFHLFFDRWEFSRERSHKLSLAARIAAGRPPSVRTQADTERLYSVLKNLVYFKEKFSEEKKRELCKVIWYLSCEKGRVVLRQGHPGSHFYLIYSGCVMVQIDVIDPLTEDPVTMEISRYGPGATFGELALLREGARRTATVICDQPTELFQIDKDDFNRICQDVYQAELEFKCAMAASYHLFQGWDAHALRELCFQSVIVQVPYAKVIERDWSTSNYVYFVLEGKMEVLSEVQLPPDRCPEPPSQLFTGGFLSGMQEEEEEEEEGDSEGEEREAGAARYTTRSPIARGWYNHDCRKHNHGYMSVGMLYPGQSSDLRILEREQAAEVRPLILTSLGTKLLRFSARLIKETAPPGSLTAFLSHAFTPMQVPVEPQLQKIYCCAVAWAGLKRHMTNTLLEERQGQPLAFTPASLKAL